MNVEIYTEQMYSYEEAIVGDFTLWRLMSLETNSNTINKKVSAAFGRENSISKFKCFFSTVSAGKDPPKLFV
ncbi:hypothetical protein [Chryseobacterium indoltheticum]|uniref:hypothetical protein n=1 Tax=Chryseobacterium indoltheticum TaxID=254 RepID=UPI003F497E2D